MAATLRNHPGAGKPAEFAVAPAGRASDNFPFMHMSSALWYSGCMNKPGRSHFR